MSFKKNINDIKKNYSLGIIGGGQLALMLTEAAKKRDLEVCVQTKSCDDPAGLKADHVIEADPLKIRGNKSLINESEKLYRRKSKGFCARLIRAELVGP